MVNDRTLKGKDITRHPLEVEGQAVNLYTRTPPIMCIRAEQGGRLVTNRGEETFHAGDWICTDYPPTYAWIIDQQGFAYANYVLLGAAGEEQIVFPVAEADHEVEHTLYRGIAEPEEPAERQVVEVELLEVATTTTPLHESQKVTAVRPSHPPTKAGLPQQSPQQAMSQGTKPARAPKRA